MKFPYAVNPYVCICYPTTQKVSDDGWVKEDVTIRWTVIHSDNIQSAQIFANHLAFDRESRDDVDVYFSSKKYFQVSLKRSEEAPGMACGMWLYYYKRTIRFADNPPGESHQIPRFTQKLLQPEMYPLERGTKTKDNVIVSVNETKTGRKCDFGNLGDTGYVLEVNNFKNPHVIWMNQAMFIADFPTEVYCDSAECFVIPVEYITEKRISVQNVICEIKRLFSK